MGKDLYIFVEGPDDERFFEKIISPYLNNHTDIHYLKYKEQTSKWVNKYLITIKSMKCDYIFFHDRDKNCVSIQKQALLDCYKSLDEENVIIIVKEIEGWYLAGLNKRNSQILGIKFLPCTDDICKEKFKRINSSYGPSKILFMLEILKHYDIEMAKSKNKSFRYYATKISL